MKLRTRILWFIGFLLIGLAVAFSISSAGVFFNRYFAGGVADYNEVTKEQLKNNQPMDGIVYFVYDCIAEGYTERKSDSGTVLSTTTDSYYYLIPFEENEVMVIEIPAKTELDEQMEDLMDAGFLNDDEDELLDKAVEISGVVKENESEIVKFFNEWCDDYEIEGVTLIPYTIDCTSSYEVECQMFLIALAFYAAFIIYIVILILVFVKSRRSGRSYAPAAPYQNVGGDQFFVPNNQNNYDPAATYQSGIPQAQDTQFQAQTPTHTAGGMSLRKDEPANNGIPTPSNSYGQTNSQNSASSSNFGFGNSNDNFNNQ